MLKQSVGALAVVVLALAFVLPASFGCGGGGGGGSGGGGGAMTYPRPSVVGTYGFDAGLIGPSTQTGGGATAGDNMSINISEGCDVFADKSVSIQAFSHDHSMLAAGTIQVEKPSSGTAGNLFANVTYYDMGASNLQFPASSGTVTFDNIDFSNLQNNRGSFSVQLELDDGGTSSLSGTFDDRYLCR